MANGSVATPVIFAANMLTGASLQSSVEAIKSKAAAVELVREALGLPTHTYGWGTDAPFVGAQSCIESTMNANIIRSAGCDILGGAGQMEVATTISPVQLVIDEEIAETLRGITGGLHLDDDTMAWEELLSCKAGDNFLALDHTFRHCRDTFVPKGFTRNPWSEWNASGRQTLLDRAKERYETILDETSEGVDDVGLATELDGIVERSDRNLCK